MKIKYKKDDIPAIRILKRLKQDCYVPSRDGSLLLWGVRVLFTSQTITELKERRAKRESEALKKWTAEGESVESFYTEVVPELRKFKLSSHSLRFESTHGVSHIRAVRPKKL